MFCGIFYSYFFRPSRDFPAGFLIGLRFVESNLGGVPRRIPKSETLSHKKGPKALKVIHEKTSSAIPSNHHRHHHHHHHQGYTLIPHKGII